MAKSGVPNFIGWIWDLLPRFQDVSFSVLFSTPKFRDWSFVDFVRFYVRSSGYDLWWHLCNHQGMNFSPRFEWKIPGPTTDLRWTKHGSFSIASWEKPIPSSFKQNKTELLRLFSILFSFKKLPKIHIFTMTGGYDSWIKDSRPYHPGQAAWSTWAFHRRDTWQILPRDGPWWRHHRFQPNPKAETGRKHVTGCDEIGKTIRIQLITCREKMGS